MKKFLVFFAVISLFAFAGCSARLNVPNQTGPSSPPNLMPPVEAPPVGK